MSSNVESSNISDKIPTLPSILRNKIKCGSIISFQKSRKGSLVLSHCGNEYLKDKNGNKKIYYKCRIHSCHGRGIFVDDMFTTTVPHDICIFKNAANNIPILNYVVDDSIQETIQEPHANSILNNDYLINIPNSNDSTDDIQNIDLNSYTTLLSNNTEDNKNDIIKQSINNRHILCHGENKYRKDKNKNGTIYYRCKVSNCHGRGKYKNNLFTPTEPHDKCFVKINNNVPLTCNNSTMSKNLIKTSNLCKNGNTSNLSNNIKLCLNNDGNIKINISLFNASDELINQSSNLYENNQVNILVFKNSSDLELYNKKNITNSRCSKMIQNNQANDINSIFSNVDDIQDDSHDPSDGISEIESCDQTNNEISNSNENFEINEEINECYLTTSNNYIKSSKGIPFIYINKYLYSCNRTHGLTKYYRCIRQTCYGRGTLLKNIFRVKKNHSHEQDTEKYLDLQLRNLVKINKRPRKNRNRETLSKTGSNNFNKF
ncbi:GATA zinc finger domain-containing protein 4-like isoform X2 [Gordionus sp. m RMFG-2023]|uniref:GATA zinc finger domain-containing protein 4-like isoform X2 n=1 Tax=Gordionus sp. m RMFG-2023 TaxID=3053472 RepID=UPI0031FC1D51